MPTPVFLTVDTEMLWRHHRAGLPLAEQVTRAFEPAEVGLSYQLETLKQHDLKACFFVDPLSALTYGLDPVRRVVGKVLEGGQEVQLHLHPCWVGAKAGDGGAGTSHGELGDYSIDKQRDLIGGALDLLIAAGAPHPIAFRGGNYAASDDTIQVLADFGFEYDSTHNGAEAPHPSKLSLPRAQIAPVAIGSVVEVPITQIEEAPGRFRQMQICALSKAEMRGALEHAIRERHAAVNVVTHAFELANRAGTRANAVHVARFDSLCATLDEWRADLPTVHFKDRPKLRLGQKDQPLAPSALRTRWRQAEQLWSNLIEERAA